MAETLLSFGVEKLMDLLVRESERLQGFDEQFTELKRHLNLLRCFLKDADAKKHASASVRNCVEEIKEIVFDTEDIIETYLLKEELRKSSSIKKCMRRLSYIQLDRRQIALAMGVMSKRISKVIPDMQSFGVQQLIVNSGGYSHPLQEGQREMGHTFPTENENIFVGLEGNVKKLVGYLVEKESIQVVSICGMGGIGKTTMARQVFNHEMVRNHFDGVAWVCVSQTFTRKYVWETILQELSSKHTDEDRESKMNIYKLQEKLFELLKTSNSLIVLDDMWNEEDWDRIKPAFPPTKGWKVLITSRNEGVARHADPTCFTFKPECLTPEESWRLFQMIAFPRKNATEYKVDEEMEEMGKQMIKNCGGLPLAVKVLGGLLKGQYELHEWKRIYENIRSCMFGNSIYHVLSLSFEELPIYLKQCFLYLTHFPEDCPIDVEDLSYYWEADGIPRPRYYGGASIREVADGYIEELVKRNMVISKRDVRTGRFEECQLHDMMREVCLLKAEEENFVQIIVDGASTANSQSPFRSRRLAIHRLGGKCHSEMKNPKLRSLMFIKTEAKPGLCFARIQLMRVLDLSRAKFEGAKLPSDIGKLIHLRYLSLHMAWVSHLPSSMRNLKQLLYLNLHVLSRCTLHIPNCLNEMRELRYLFLPYDIDDKTKLELGNLVYLETLKNFSTEHSSVRDLQGMTRLRVLSVFIGEEGCTMETLSSSLSGLNYLENLTIDNRRVHRRHEEGFVLKCVHLKQLTLKGIYMPRLPDEQHFPSHLTTIDLSGCRLEEDPMPILEKLLHLKEVRLEDQSFSGRRMVCSGSGFPQLEELYIWGLDELEEWIVEEGSMPLLHTLKIDSCKKLKELPDGLRFLTSLKELRITDMERDFTKKLEKGGEDYYKVQHIPSVRLE